MSLFLAMPFIESLDFISLDSTKWFIWGYGFMASHGNYGHGLISWIHKIIGFHSPGCVPWASILPGIYLFVGFYFVKCRYSWIVLIHRIHFFVVGMCGLAHWITNLFFILFLARFIEARIYSSLFSWFDLLKQNLFSYLPSILK